MPMKLVHTWAIFQVKSPFAKEVTDAFFLHLLPNFLLVLISRMQKMLTKPRSKRCLQVWTCLRWEFFSHWRDFFVTTFCVLNTGKESSHSIRLQTAGHNLISYKALYCIQSKPNVLKNVNVDLCTSRFNVNILVNTRLSILFIWILHR